MIDRNQLLSLGYYTHKSAPAFTGSDGIKCYKIKRHLVKNEETKAVECDELLASLWKGPLSSECTDSTLILTKSFPMSEDGLSEAAVWLNETSPLEETTSS